MQKRIIEVGRLRKRDDTSLEDLTIEKINSIREQFRELARDSRRPIIFRFGSVRGGDVDEGLDFGDEIRESKIHTIGHAMANAKIASAGVYLFICMTKRIGHPKAKFLLYPEWYPIRGPLIESIPKKGVPPELLAKVKETGNRMSKVLVEQTDLSQKSVTKILSFIDDYVLFSLDVAHVHGIVHEIRKT